MVDKISGNQAMAEEIRSKGKVIAKIIGSGKLLKTHKTYPFYTIKGKYETVRYGELSRFIAFIPESAKLTYSFERDDFFNSSSTVMYDCGDNIYVEYYSGNADNPSEFIIYIYLNKIE
jgi:hypothetical protein